MTYDEVRNALIHEAENLVSAKYGVAKDQNYKLGKINGMIKAFMIAGFIGDNWEKLFDEAHDIILCKKYEYSYGMRNRGFSLWCQPMEGLVRREDCPVSSNRKYYDVLVYNRMLTDKELYEYELDYIGKKEVS